MVLHNLGNRIREERLKCRFTQEQLAELVGCNESYIGQIERGVKNPSLETVVGIANALNVTVDYLLSDSIKIDRSDYLVDEMVSLVREKEPEDVRLLISMSRMFVDYLDKKGKKKK